MNGADESGRPFALKEQSQSVQKYVLDLEDKLRHYMRLCERAYNGREAASDRLARAGKPQRPSGSGLKGRWSAGPWDGADAAGASSYNPALLSRRKPGSFLDESLRDDNEDCVQGRDTIVDDECFSLNAARDHLRRLTRAREPTEQASDGGPDDKGTSLPDNVIADAYFRNVIN